MAASRVAVVGGGLAGLAAATALKEAGRSVELFERTRLLGGRATSFFVDDLEVDNGQHVFLGCCTAFIAFVQRLGLAPSIYLQERFDVVVLGGGKRSRLRETGWPVPFNLAPSLLGYRHIPFKSRVGIARALLAARSALDSELTFAQWLRDQRQDADATRGFWEPFLVPALNLPLGEMRAADAAFVLVTAFLSEPGAARFGWSKAPLAHIARRAAERLDDVHLSTTVAGIEAGPGEIGLRLPSGERRTFDAVVLALTPQQLARLLGETSRFGVPSLDGYEARAIVDVHLWHDRGALDFEFAALLDSPVQWVFQKEEGYVCCSLSAADAYLTAATSDLVDRAWSELRAAVPALAGARLERSAVTRNPAATFVPRIGIKRPAARTALPNLALAGSWLATGWPDTMESAVRSGLDAAAVLQSVEVRSAG